MALRGLSVLVLGMSALPLATPSSAGDFTLKPVELGYPGDTIVYQMNDAKKLAGQFLPAASDQVVEAIVHEEVMIPSSAYVGLSFEFLLTPRVIDSTLCEQPIITIEMHPIDENSYRGQPRNVTFTLKEGSLERHTMYDIYRHGRYRRLRAEDRSPLEPAIESCRRLAATAATWKPARDISVLLEQERSLNRLLQVLRSTKAKITCIETGQSLCGSEQRPEAVERILDAMPPSYSQRLSTHGSTTTVFEYSAPANPGGMGYSYTITMREVGQQPTEIRFESRSNPVPVV